MEVIMRLVLILFICIFVVGCAEKLKLNKLNHSYKSVKVDYQFDKIDKGLKIKVFSKALDLVYLIDMTAEYMKDGKVFDRFYFVFDELEPDETIIKEIPVPLEATNVRIRLKEVKLQGENPIYRRGARISTFDFSNIILLNYR
jgi:hypothetical protein